ncbi:MAG: hypothetical protein ACP5OC_08570 [Thermoplasmata archaeon]
MTDEKPTLASRILHLPILILLGLVIFVIFLIVAVAAGIVAAAYEFGNAFRAFFGHYFEIPVIAVILIILGIVLHFRKGKSSSNKNAGSEEPSVSEKPSEAPAAPVQEETSNEEAKEAANSDESKKE